MSAAASMFDQMPAPQPAWVEEQRAEIRARLERFQALSARQEEIEAAILAEAVKLEGMRRTVTDYIAELAHVRQDIADVTRSAANDAALLLRVVEAREHRRA